MKRLISMLLISGGLWVSPLYAQIVTENPKVEEYSVSYVTITRVELTRQYTIIDLIFRNPKSTVPGASPFQFPGMPQNSGSQIWLDPNTRLYKPGEIDVKFKFIKAEGIPTASRRSVGSGEEVAFRAYFERLTPGIEEFDFYEGRSDGRGQTWNFYGIHISNPIKQDETPRQEKKDAPETRQIEAPVSGEVRPSEDIFILNGVVYDVKTRTPIKSTITYVEMKDTISTSFSSGNYRLNLNAQGNYSLLFNSPGYLSKVVEVTKSELNRPDTLEVYLLPLAEGVSFTLDNIYFETSKFDLLQESFKELDELVSILKATSTLRIRVEGHTDNVGDFDKNLELSKKRAQAVKDYLLTKGIAKERVEIQGYGQTRPVAKGQSEEEKSKNRRVEIIILKV